MRLVFSHAVIVAPLCLVAASAVADSAGHWVISRAPDGIKAGLVFPEYSENDFVGMSLLCVPGGESVTLSFDSKTHMKSGARVRVALTVDDAQTAYDGRAENSQMDDQTRILVETARRDPALEALGRARRIAYAIGGAPEPLPTKDSARVIPEFLSACGTPAAADAAGANRGTAASGITDINDSIVDEPEWGFALRIPPRWNYERADENGVRTWKVRNPVWTAGTIPDDLLSVTVTAIARTPGSNPEQEFRGYVRSFATKFLGDGAVNSFSPTRMGEFGGYIATATGRIASRQGVQFDVGAIVILLETSTSHVIASAIAPSASGRALDAIGKAGGMFGPSAASVRPSPITQARPVEAAAPPSPAPASDPSTPLQSAAPGQDQSAAQAQAAQPTTENRTRIPGLIAVALAVAIILTGALAFVRRHKSTRPVAQPPPVPPPPVAAPRFCTACGERLAARGPCPKCGAEEEA